jgi:pimeloyl-ACP methyl ester carboxylesterase
MSLLDVGARVGFAVWAPDRPGYGLAADLPDERLRLHPQAELLERSILDVADRVGERLRVVLVAHSYGLKVGLVLAARPWEGRLAGIDGVGTGQRFRPDRQPVPGDVGPAWGPRRGYPAGTFAKGALPLAPVPAVQTKENPRWADDLADAAPTIRVPVQVAYGEFERFWPTDEDAFTRFRGLFSRAPRVDVRVIPGVGHNVSLSVQARAYHLRCLAFAEACLVVASTIPPS